jgi:predicted NUDIX family NTP pyrophosphohydrolase
MTSSSDRGIAQRSRCGRLGLTSKRFLDFALIGKRILLTVKRSKTSAGLLMFRKKNNELEVLLVHPGGPYFQKKDEGAWSIPKGEVSEGEDLFARAKIEFEEELGLLPLGDWMELGSAEQKGGKTVHAWAFAGNLKDDFKPVSNTFEMEWPPRSGVIQRFPEVDKASFFPVEEARRKINAAQTVFLDRLIDQLDSRQDREV